MTELFIQICISLYLLSLTIILIYSSQGYIMLHLRKKYSAKTFLEEDIFEQNKKMTIQLPVYNEKFVIERLLNSVCDIDYPKELLQIQVLDDSTDETTDIAQRIVEAKRIEGFDIELIHRNDRSGYKAGALAMSNEITITSRREGNKQIYEAKVMIAKGTK